MGVGHVGVCVALVTRGCVLAATIAASMLGRQSMRMTAASMWTRNCATEISMTPLPLNPVITRHEIQIHIVLCAGKLRLARVPKLIISRSMFRPITLV